MTKLTPPDQILQDHAQMLALQTAVHKPEITERYGYTTVTGIMATSHLRKRENAVIGMDLESIDGFTIDGVNDALPKIVAPLRIHRYRHS